MVRVHGLWRPRLRLPFRRILTKVSPYAKGNGVLLTLLSMTSFAGGFAQATLLYLLIQVATAVTAGTQRITVSVGPVQGAHLSIPAAFALSGAMLALFAVLTLYSSWAIARLTTGTVTRARKLTMASYVGAAWPVQSREPEGRLQEVLTAHVQRVAIGMMQVAAGIAAMLNLAAFLVAAFLIGPVAALVVFAGVAVVAAALLPVARHTKRLSQRNVVRGSEYARGVSQAVSLAREIRTFDVGGRVVSDLAASADSAEMSGFRVRLLQRLTPSIYQSGALLLLLLGLVLVHALRLSNVGDLGAIVLLMVRALSYGQQISAAIQVGNETLPYLDTIEVLRSTYDKASVPPTGLPLRRVDTMSLRGASFAYEPGRPVLRTITAEFTAGEAIGIVGPSGSGKSTLVHLLLRLFPSAPGTYLVNGDDAADFAVHDWFHAFAFVPQNNRLLHGSVADNIRLFREGVTADDIEVAARRANLHDDVVTWRDGYDTVIGPGAQDVSGGQLQRLGLARALVGSPSVLVLDEPTSALDMRSEELIRETLTQLKGEMTMFIVAHRVSTLNLCDRILVLEKGQVSALGPRGDVSASSGFFRDAERLARARG